MTRKDNKSSSKPTAVVALHGNKPSADGPIDASKLLACAESIAEMNRAQYRSENSDQSATRVQSLASLARQSGGFKLREDDQAQGKGEQNEDHSNVRAFRPDRAGKPPSQAE